MKKDHRNLLFLTGVHGVGKTTLSKKIATKFGFLYLNAGIKLIAKQQTLEIEYARQLAGELKVGLLTISGRNESRIYKNLEGFLAKAAV